jgi:hypothetical protein
LTGNFYDLNMVPTFTIDFKKSFLRFLIIGTYAITTNNVFAQSVATPNLELGSSKGALNNVWDANSTQAIVAPSSKENPLTTMAVCAGGTAASSTSICTSGTTTISISGETFGTDVYVWEQNLNGAGWTVIAGATSATYVTGTLTYPNSYQYRRKSSNASTFWCTGTGTSVAVTVAPSAAQAGPDAFACNDGYTLAADALTTGATGLWTLYNGTGTITTPTSATSTLTALGAGINTFAWTVTNGTCSTVDYVNVTEGAYDAYSSAACLFNAGTVILTVANYNSNAIQWQQNVNNGGWVNIVGAIGATSTPCTTASLTTSTASPAYYQYRAKLTTGGCTDYSAISTVGDSYCATTCAVCTSCTTSSTAGCTTTYNANSSTAFTANSGTKLCITGGTYTGAITYTPNVDNGTIVVASGAVFNPSNAMSLANSGMILEIKAGATATISSISNANTTFTLNNCGSITVTGNFSTGNGAGNINNVGTYTSSGDLTFANTGAFCNSGTASMRDLSISNSGTIQNNGIINASRDFSLANAGVVSICPNSQINVTRNMSAANGTITGISSCGAITVSGTGGTGSSFANYNISGFNMCDPHGTGTPNVVSFSLGSASNMSYCTCTHVTLPIELISFTAHWYSNNKDKVITKWVTASEIGNDHFTIERTEDGETFVEVGTLSGAGNSNSILQYSLIDDNPVKGISYYRLKQTDYDGNFAYSKLVAVETDLQDQLQLFYLFADQNRNSLDYQYSYSGNKAISVEVIDVLGNAAAKQISDYNNTDQELNLDISNLSKGVYLFRVSDGTNAVIKKFLY